MLHTYICTIGGDHCSVLKYTYVQTYVRTYIRTYMQSSFDKQSTVVLVHTVKFQ